MIQSVKKVQLTVNQSHLFSLFSVFLSFTDTTKMVAKLQNHKNKRRFTLCQFMAATSSAPILFIVFIFLASNSASASETHQLHRTGFSTARTLLQVQQSCPVNFEGLNYTIITSRCKGPRYPPKVCCEAFKDLACPYADDLNDEKNNCATTMFSYINLYGHYPPGIFSNECRDSKRGLECTEAQSSLQVPTPSAAATSTIAQHHTLQCLFFFVSLYYLFF